MPGRTAWALLGHRTGDDNQVLALAEALDISFEAKRLTYGPSRLVPNGLSAEGFYSLNEASRALLVPPWPDLVIGVGQRPVKAMRAVARASEGRTRTVGIGRPRCDPRLLDAVVTTRNYAVPRRENVLVLPVAMTRESDEAGSPGFPRPWHVLLVGGPSWPWSLSTEKVVAAALSLAARAEREGGSAIAFVSRRTPAALTASLRGLASDEAALRVLAPGEGADGTYGTVLHGAATIAVTADSVSMISDAVATGAPVGIVPTVLGAGGKAIRAAQHALHHSAGIAPGRDVAAFVDEARSAGMVGTVEAPTNVGVTRTADRAAAWLKARFGWSDTTS